MKPMTTPKAGAPPHPPLHAAPMPL